MGEVLMGLEVFSGNLSKIGHALNSYQELPERYVEMVGKAAPALRGSASQLQA